jgi:hypothetical protein
MQATPRPFRQPGAEHKLAAFTLHDHLFAASAVRGFGAQCLFAFA